MCSLLPHHHEMAGHGGVGARCQGGARGARRARHGILAAAVMPELREAKYPVPRARCHSRPEPWVPALELTSEARMTRSFLLRRHRSRTTSAEFALSPLGRALSH